MNNLIVMNSSMFGDVRFINLDGKPYAVANDVAKVLGYTNPTKAINDHCVNLTKRYTPHPQNKDKQLEVNVIPEGDIYRLIIKSKLPKAQEFECWIMDEVLPQIRQTGGYIPVSQEDDEKLILAKAFLIAQKTIEKKAKLVIKNYKKINKILQKKLCTVL